MVPPAAGSSSARFGNPGPALKTGIGIAAMLLLLVPLITVAADARGGGGGGGGGEEVAVALVATLEGPAAMVVE